MFGFWMALGVLAVTALGLGGLRVIMVASTTFVIGGVLYLFLG